MERETGRSEFKTRGYLFLIGTTLGAVVGFIAGLIVAWRIGLKVWRWLWRSLRHLAGRQEDGDEIDFQMLVQ